jgi:hypothetical protein
MRRFYRVIAILTALSTPALAEQKLLTKDKRFCPS